PARQANCSCPGTRFQRFPRFFRKWIPKKNRRTFPGRPQQEGERTGRKSKRKEEMARCAYLIGIGSESLRHLACAWKISWMLGMRMPRKRDTLSVKSSRMNLSLPLKVGRSVVVRESSSLATGLQHPAGIEAAGIAARLLALRLHQIFPTPALGGL